MCRRFNRAGAHWGDLGLCCCCDEPHLCVSALPHKIHPSQRLRSTLSTYPLHGPQYGLRGCRPCTQFTHKVRPMKLQLVSAQSDWHIFLVLYRLGCHSIVLRLNVQVVRSGKQVHSRHIAARVLILAPAWQHCVTGGV